MKNKLHQSESATETPTETSVPPTSVESVAEPTRPLGLDEKFATPGRFTKII